MIISLFLKLLLRYLNQGRGGWSFAHPNYKVAFICLHVHVASKQQNMKFNSDQKLCDNSA